MRSREYAVSSRVRRLGLALAVVAAPAFFAAQAQTIPPFGPITPGNIGLGPGVAGPANPLTFDPLVRPGIAGPANPLQFDATVTPGVAGPANPLTFDPAARPGIAGIPPLNGGLVFSTFVPNNGAVVDPSAFPLLARPGIAGTTFAPGVAGPVNPATFDPISEPGVAGSTAPALIEPAGGTTTSIGFAGREGSNESAAITNEGGRLRIVRRD